MNHQQYPLAVKPSDHDEMDLPVEATVHLSSFSNKTEARNILKSHGFELKDLSSDQVRVKGSFLKLQAAKASLEKLRSKTDIPPDTYSPVLSGATSKCFNHTASARGRSGSRNKSPLASPSSPKAPSPVAYGSTKNSRVSPDYRGPFTPGPDQSGSFQPERESFLVDTDVFEYAKKLRKKDIDLILENHNVIMKDSDITEESCSITLMGKNAKTAAGKLQNLLCDLNKSLRTQEVPLKDMDHEGRALWERIRKNENLHNSVLVSQTTDKLHLIGSSKESYDLKQRLLGEPVGNSGRTGRTHERNSRLRSSSLPPISRRNTGRDTGANTNPSPGGAAGYSSSKYQSDKQNQFEPKPPAATGFNPGSLFRRRSQSESRKKPKTQQTYVDLQETLKKSPSAKPPKTTLRQLLSTENILQKLKSRNTKKNEK
ncbi:uncharacterized protein si:dkey-154b15.1 [Xyrichtys novacula]|uniref:Uncharacterized protein si:dkey-154b15.1 n=1 Tax=Xyrichtys novacula TaxID=13765 RepID=A0AAV1HBA8_XYRNO|nr:uncharacterized protein si:dkey-154b15.1 [Xyrichtys novacula]